MKDEWQNKCVIMMTRWVKVSVGVDVGGDVGGNVGGDMGGDVGIYTLDRITIVK